MNERKSNIKRYVNIAMIAAALCFAAVALVDRAYPPPVPVDVMRLDAAAYGGVLVAPYDAVRQDGAGCEYVYIIRENRAEKRGIITAAEYADGFEVFEGISDGAMVVMNPDDLSGEHVRIRPHRR